MNLRLDAKRLVQNLQEAQVCTPESAASFVGEVNKHLLQNYLTPFLQENTPTLSELDFSAFSLEDVNELERYLNCMSRTGEKLFNFCNTFGQATPVAQSHRAFC